MSRADFNIWWEKEGSGITPRAGDDMESHAKRVAEIAWSNGEYKAANPENPTGQGMTHETEKEASRGR